MQVYVCHDGKGSTYHSDLHQILCTVVDVRRTRALLSSVTCLHLVSPVPYSSPTTL